MQWWIEQYGYWAVFFGCLVEGETALVLGSLAARLGYLDIRTVVLAAVAGTLVIDQTFYYLGRRYGDALLARWPSGRMRAQRVSILLIRYDVWFILGFRFFYGLRTVSPFVIGISGVAPRRFLVLNFVAASVWATAVGAVAFVLGRAIERFVARLEDSQVFIFAAVLAAGILVAVVRMVLVKRRTRRYVARTPELEGPRRPGGRDRARRPDAKRPARRRGRASVDAD